MPRKRLRRPTDAELEILGVLWRRGPSTVRQVADELNRHRKVGYTTALKLMQIMLEKGLLVRDAPHGVYVYRPRASERQTKRHLLRDLAARTFGGSLEKLAIEALGRSRPSPEEIDELRKLIDRLEEQQQ